MPWLALDEMEFTTNCLRQVSLLWGMESLCNMQLGMNGTLQVARPEPPC
jgi:hypothetical protein